MSVFGNLFGGGNEKESNGATVDVEDKGTNPKEDQSKADSTTTKAAPESLDDLLAIMVKSPAKAKGSNEAPLDLETLAADSNAFNQLADSQDFMSSIPKELLERMNNGESSAFIEAMQLTTKAAYAAALRHAAMLSGKGLAASRKGLPSDIESTIENALKRKAVQAAAPEDAHPAAKFMVTATAKALMEQYPSLSPEQASAKAAEFLQEMGRSVQRKPKPTKASLSWDEYYDSLQQSEEN